MKLKRNALWVLLFGVVILLTGLLTPFGCLINCTSHQGAIGIIGGAEVPTYQFMFWSLLDGWPFVLILLGISLVLSACFCLLFSKTVNKCCRLTTSAISLGLSAVGALGLACVLLWLSIVTFGNMSRYPIQYPLSILLGMFCFCVFMILLALYFKARKGNWLWKGLLIDFLTSIICLPTFFFAFSYLYAFID